MRSTFSITLVAAAAALLAAGCAGPEKKLGRGINNTMEIVRWGETRRSVEQTALFYSPEEGYTRGLITGFNRTMARTGIGIYEIITFPIPSYEPVFTNYLTANPVFPDSYRPGLKADQNFATDTYMGMSGGEIMPLIPGSRFRIFDP